MTYEKEIQRRNRNSKNGMCYIPTSCGICMATCSYLGEVCMMYSLIEYVSSLPKVNLIGTGLWILACVGILIFTAVRENR